jgi:hypothetical protein
MTLHAAIEQLLKQKKRAMTATEIADELNKNKWYIKKDQSLIRASQISARVNKYHKLFDVVRNVSPYSIKLLIK